MGLFATHQSSSRFGSRGDFMIIGYNFLESKDSVVFDSPAPLSEIERLDVEKAVFDEVHIREKTEDTCSKEKTEWQVDTKLKAEFNESLEAGNIDLQEDQIEFVRMLKRKKGEFNWQTMIEIPFHSDLTTYTHNDRFIMNDQEYEYAIQPVAYGGFEGNRTISSIRSEFESTWLLDNEQQYKLVYDVDYGAMSTRQQSSTIETLGSKYPIISYNGNLKYKQGTVSARIIADDSLFGKISVEEERRLRNQLVNFLSNKKPKLIKDAGGNLVLIQITEDVSITPDNQFEQKLYSIDFNWVEIGDAEDHKDLKRNALGYL